MHADERRPQDEDTRSDAGGNRINEAIALLETLTASDTLEDFLTLPAYARID